MDNIEDLISQVIANVKEKGTYVYALLTFGDRLKNIKLLTNEADKILLILAKLVEESDSMIFPVLRILYLSQAPPYFRTVVVLQRPKLKNLLVTAIIANNWKFANFLVKYAGDDSQLNQADFWDPQSDHKATPDQWGKALRTYIIKLINKYIVANSLELLVKSFVTSRVVPSGISNVTKLTDLWVSHLGHIKPVLDNGYVTLLELIKYPSAFMLMVRLGADLTFQNNEVSNMTLPYYIWSSRMNKVKRTHLLKFLESVDPTLFDIPCGPNKVKLVYYCLRYGDLSIVKSIPALLSGVDMTMRDSKSRGIGYYIHPTLIYRKFFSSKDFLAYAENARIGRTYAVNMLLLVSPWRNPKYHSRYPLIMKAVDTLIQKDKTVLEKYLQTATDKFLIAYCISRGHRCPKENKIWDELALARSDVIEKQYFVRDLFLEEEEQRPFEELPDDVIILIILELKFEEMMRLFATSRPMRNIYQRLASPSLWKAIAANNFNGFKMKYLLSQPITDWQSHVIKEMRWRHNWNHQRFTERPIFSELDTNFCYIADDNWFVLTELRKREARCWNCHTGEVFSMQFSRALSNVYIVKSTPTSCNIAICSDQWTMPVIYFVDPIAGTVLKEIECYMPDSALPRNIFFFKYQSKLCYMASDLVEVDIEAGVTKVLQTLPSRYFTRSVVVNLNEDTLFLDQYSDNHFIIDADRNFVAAEKPPYTQHIVVTTFRQARTEFKSSWHMLEFGQWSRHCGDDTMSYPIIDVQNSRLVVPYGVGGVSWLVHPNLKTWYTAWVRTKRHYSIAMNSRYLFCYDEKSNSIYCRDFD